MRKTSEGNERTLIVEGRKRKSRTEEERERERRKITSDRYTIRIKSLEKGGAAFVFHVRRKEEVGGDGVRDSFNDQPHYSEKRY